MKVYRNYELKIIYSERIRQNQTETVKRLSRIETQIFKPLKFKGLVFEVLIPLTIEFLKRARKVLTIWNSGTLELVPASN